VPHADGSLHALPPGGLSDADACMFSDVFPTAYECAAPPRVPVRPRPTPLMFGCAGLLMVAIRRLSNRLRARRAAAHACRTAVGSVFGCAGLLPLAIRRAAARRPWSTRCRPRRGRRCGVLPGAVMPGSRFAVVGAGPIGLAALQTASLLSPAAVFVLDVSDARLQACPPPALRRRRPARQCW